MIIVHTAEEVVYIVQEEDGVEIFRQEDNVLLAEGELVEITFDEIVCTVMGNVVWRATLQGAGR